MNLTEAVKAAGVVGAGGAGFPTHVKLSAKAECFLVNAAECEPLIETDKYLCRTFPDRVVAAAVAVAGHLGAKRTVIALKGKYHAEITALEGAISRSGAQVELFRMKTFYPAGDEQTMVQQVTGRSVPERGLPLDVGCVVDNVGTLLNIQDALEGTPVTEKYLSVVGEVKEPILLKVPVGTALTACVAEARPNLADYALIVGGPMMGKPLTDRAAIEAAVVTKTTGNLIVLPKEHYLFRRAQLPMETIRHQTKSACIQCRMCTDLCPRYLIGHQIRPNLVMRNLWREGSIEDNEEYLRSFGDAANCCDCGVCEMFACPMGLSPRKVNGYIKGELRKRGIQVPRNMEPHAREFVDERKTPTDRLVARPARPHLHPPGAGDGMHPVPAANRQARRACQGRGRPGGKGRASGSGRPGRPERQHPRQHRRRGDRNHSGGRQALPEGGMNGMANAIGMVELTSIARGIETSDFMVKAAQVELIRSSTVCPGKYIIIIAGDTGDVKASMAEGIRQGGESVVNTLLLPNAHPQLIPAISMTTQPPAGGAVGVLEFYSIASAITAADVAAKAANVTLIEVRIGYAIGGKGFVTLTGDVGAVREAVAAASRDAELLVGTSVIPRPAQQVFQSLL